MSDGQGTTLDEFLGGQIAVEQPRIGYRAGVDPVLLAGAVPAKAGQSVLELGCGVGVASLCLGRRVHGLHLFGVERQESYAALARDNALRNDLDFHVEMGDLEHLPDTLRSRSFDHVIANPPYFKRDRSQAAIDEGREIAMGEDTPLDIWVKTAAKRLALKGTATFIHRAERLPDLLHSVTRYLGSVQVLPLVPREGRDARLILLRARKGGKASFRLHDSLTVHRGKQHDRDQDDYTPAIKACLRDGQTLPFPD